METAGQTSGGKNFQPRYGSKLAEGLKGMVSKSSNLI